MVSKSIINKCKKIKIVLTDVDGVLTDGGMYYSAKGDVMKRFFVRDGMAVTLLWKNGIPTIVITKEKNMIIRQWTKNMKVKKLYEGVIKKELILKKICSIFELSPNNVAYIGDDINDIELLKRVGLSVVPNDGILEAKKICNYVCKHKAGRGSFRELADLILLTQKVKHKITK